MLNDILIVVVAVALGSVLGRGLKIIRGDNWRNSIRGMLFATSLIAIALGLLVWNWQK